MKKIDLAFSRIDNIDNRFKYARGTSKIDKPNFQSLSNMGNVLNI